MIAPTSEEELHTPGQPRSREEPGFLPSVAVRIPNHRLLCRVVNHSSSNRYQIPDSRLASLLVSPVSVVSFQEGRELRAAWAQLQASQIIW